MRPLEACVLYSIRLAILLCCIAVPVSAQTSLPTIIQETETAGSYTYTGTWYWNGQDYSATWNNQAAATLTVKNFVPSSVEIIRTDLSNTTSEGLTATY